MLQECDEQACWNVGGDVRDCERAQVACMAGTMAPQWEGDMEHLLIKEAWGVMAAHTELAAMAAACTGGLWEPPWDPTGATALAWGAAMDLATGAACTGGLMAATTAMAPV